MDASSAVLHIKGSDLSSCCKAGEGFCWAVLQAASIFLGYCQMHFSDSKNVFLSAAFCWVVSGNYCRCNWTGNEQS